MSNTQGILILFVSDYKASIKDKYIYEDAYGNQYEGIQTNEAPISCLIDYMIKDNCNVSKVMCLVSKKVWEENVGDTGKTSYQLFRNYLKDTFEKYQLELTEDILSPIYFDFTLSQNQDIENGASMPVALDIKEGEAVAATGVYKQIYNYVQEMKNEQLSGSGCEDEIKVYVDYTGGMRDINFLMTSIIRYLQFEGIRCQKIIYSNLFDKKIYDINYIYDMYQMINGVNEFVRTGNALQLSDMYDNLGIKIPLLESIIAFSNAMSICNLGAIDNAIIDLKQNAVTSISNENVGKQGFYLDLLNSLVPIIKEKMYLDDILVNLKGQTQVNYPVLIKWCVENRLIQQAITIYIEKMPVYYYLNGYMDSYVNIADAVPTFGGSSETALFYQNLYDSFEPNGILKTAVRNIVSDCWDDDSFFGPGPYSKPKFDAGNQKLNNKINTLANGDSIKACLERFRNILSDYYNQNTGNKKSYVGDDYLGCYGLMPGKLSVLIRTVLDNNMTAMKYVVTGSMSSASVFGTIAKKVEALKYMETQSDLHDLYEKMKYYLAMKLLRNRMNHASSSTFSPDDQVGVTYLQSQGAGFVDNGDISLQLVTNLILSGVMLEMDD